MSRKGYQGESATDRATNIMDKFIQRNERKKDNEQVRPHHKQDPNVPMELWPLSEQIEYWASLSDGQWFDREYTSYAMWFDEVKEKSGLYPTTFTDFTSKHKPFIKELFESKLRPRDAIRKLEQHGII
jgi:hypothetical protein